jgi:hypothetical protein
MSTAQALLEALGLSPRPDGQYRLNSPLRANSDSNSFSLHITDDEHGVWTDHVTSESGTLYDLIERAPQLGVERPGASIDTSKRVYTDHLDYAAQKGVSWDVFASAGMRAIRYMRRPAISIATNNGTRYRFLDYRGGDTYTNEKGFTACWYKLPEAIKMARATGHPLVYCNGEASTVVAQHFGIPAITLAGGGERNITSSLIAELVTVWSGAVVVALDCDKAGRTASAKVTKALNDAKLKAYAVDMQLGTGGDLADWAKLYAADAMAQLQALQPVSFAQSNTLQFSTISAYDLDRKSFAALNWIVEDILPEGCFILAGKPKSRKSWAATHIARCVAMGKPVFGQYTVNAKLVSGKTTSTPARVLYLDLESNERRMQSRLRQMDTGEEASKIFDIATEWSRGTQAVDDLEAYLMKYPDTALIVVDILENIRAPREKNAHPYSEDYDAVKPLNVLAEKYHCAILVIHHTRKSKGDDVFDEISGTTGLYGGVAGMYILQRMAADEKYTELHVRGRDIAMDDKRLLSWNEQFAHHELAGDIETINATKLQRIILEALDNNARLMPKQIAGLIGKAENATWNALKRMKELGMVKQDSTGKYLSVKPVAAYVPTGYEAQADEEPAPVAPMAYKALHLIPENRVAELRGLYQIGNFARAEQIAGVWVKTRPLLDALRGEILQ